MTRLFDIPPVFPPGFSYHPEALTKEEEEALLAVVQQLPVRAFRYRGYEAKRKTAGFGYDFHFDGGVLTEGAPIPEEFRWLMEKAAVLAGVRPEDFQELLVTQYPPGAVINWHRDAPPFKLIAGISLQADCIFRLRPYAGHRPTISFTARRRSLYVIEGEARTAWQHSIEPVEQERWSVTLRTLL